MLKTKRKELIVKARLTDTEKTNFKRLTEYFKITEADCIRLTMWCFHTVKDNFGVGYKDFFKLLIERRDRGDNEPIKLRGGALPPPVVDPVLISKLSSLRNEFNAIGNNLNQITERVNYDAKAEELEISWELLNTITSIGVELEQAFSDLHLVRQFYTSPSSREDS